MHELRCEDDYLVFENEETIVAAVFDGCSSGVDSHFASTFFKKTLKEYLDDESIYIVREDDNRNFPYKSCDEILHEMISHLNLMVPYSETDYLSTCVICYVNKKNCEFGIVFAGDGECCINGERHAIHDENGNAVWYLSTVDSKHVNNYYLEYCSKFFGKIENGIMISTDGIGTFKDKFNIDKSDEVRSLFYEDLKSDVDEKYLKMSYQRRYNLLKSGKIISDDKSPIRNLDDFTIIKINKLE